MTRGTGGQTSKGRRPLPATAAAALVAAGAVAYGSARLFVWPSVDPVPPKADAVVVLAGGDGDRLPKGLELMRQGRAPVLVLSIGDSRTQRRSAGRCGQRHPYEVMCKTPRLANTRGEARMVARLTQELARSGGGDATT